MSLYNPIRMEFSIVALTASLLSGEVPKKGRGSNLSGLRHGRGGRRSKIQKTDGAQPFEAQEDAGATGRSPGHDVRLSGHSGVLATLFVFSRAVPKRWLASTVRNVGLHSQNFLPKCTYDCSSSALV